MNQPKLYRLLNVGEPIQEGDEAWITRRTDSCTQDDWPIRRPTPLQGWIPIAERKPEPPCVVGFNSQAGWTAAYFTVQPDVNYWTHWHPLPPPPPKPDPDEQAFEEWRSERNSIELANRCENQKEVERLIFMAGVAHGRKAKQ